jgi:chemotaxis protein MotB
MNNWMLSSGRAEATRRRLATGGVDETQFERIEGVADREPMIAQDPADPRNRRVAITLLYRRAPGFAPRLAARPVSPLPPIRKTAS